MATAALVAGAAVAVGGPPASAAGVPDCQATETTAAQVTHHRSVPLDQLGVPEAQALVSSPGHQAGAGVNVAVVDDGVKGSAPIRVVDSYSVAGSVRVADYHGTAVAGLIAAPARPGGAPTGIAPGAGVVDVQVYGWPHGTTGSATKPTTENLITGLHWLAQHARADRVRVAVVPMAVDPHPRAALASAVRAVQDQGVLVVAPSGNRPAEGSGYLSQFASASPGQDGFADIAPANLPGVLTAGTTAAGSMVTYDVSSIPNHAVDVVVPTAHAITTALNGGACVLTAPATSWAAAEVGGIAALMFDRYAGESPSQVAARIVDTASGTADPDSTDRSLYLGAGVVQPVDALTRPLAPSAHGGFATLQARPEQTPPVRPPIPEEDALHHARSVAIWAGLAAGALVVAASILRPLLTRRTSRR